MSPFEVWRTWGLDPHPADAFFIALDEERVLGYGYLEVEATRVDHGFMAIGGARADVDSPLRSSARRWVGEGERRSRRSAPRTRCGCRRCCR